MPAPILIFSPFCLDPANACLWRGTKQLSLPPKDFAVLHYLVSHAGQLVAHDELLKAVWPDAVVSARGLKAFVGRLRHVLHDRADRPHFIETVHGQGYRFVAAVTAAPVSSFEFRVWSLETQSSVLCPQHSVLVGREAELAQLHRWLAKAQGGERQIVFATGEPGIGKTALLEAFVAGVQDQEKSQKSKGKSQKAKVLEPRTPNSELSLAPSPQPLSSSRGASASNSTARANRTCRCWTHWGGCAGNLRVSHLFLSYASTRRCGCSRCPPCYQIVRWRRSSRER